MSFTLEKVVPWGRSYNEYIEMFALTDTDLKLRILGCGDGPAAFNSELTKRGGRVVSIDPIYTFETSQIQSRISDTYSTVMEQMQKNQDDYVWNSIPTLEKLGQIRMLAMDTFTSDFEAGKKNGRYIAGELPILPFKKNQFDLALSSHFLFLYSAHLSADFHIKALREMLRIAKEVRVFPLLTLDGTRSPHLEKVNQVLSADGFMLEIKQVDYEFQRSGNEMLVIKVA